VTMSAVDVLNAHPGITVLTVDFFDTMVTRSVAQPTHVFAVVEKELVAQHGPRWRGVSAERVHAEHRARVAAAATDALRDITIDEIGDQLAEAMGLTQQERELLVRSEKATEIALAQAVPAGAAMISEAMSRGIRVLIVSDNYMPTSQLVDMAHAAGYSWVTPEHVLVSCEHGGFKHNGVLWKVALETAAVPASQILHIGDDHEADHVQSSKLGIATHIDTRMRRSHRDMHNTNPDVLALSRIEATQRDAMYDTEWDVAHALGDGLVGMIVAAQIADVKSVLQQRTIAGIHFAARDGWLAHQVWNTLRNSDASLPEASYTAFSRSVIWRASLTELTPSNVGRFIGDDEVLTIARLERRVGCSLSSLYRPDEPIDAQASRAVLLENDREVVAAAQQLRQRVLGYFEKQGLLKPGHHIVVDLGWTGSTIADMADLISEATQGATTIEARLTGMYWDATPSRMRVSMHGFALTEFESLDNNLRLLGVIKLLEALVTAPHGSVVDFADASQNFHPIFVETQPELFAYEKVIGRIGQSAISSALALLQGTHPSGVTVSEITGTALWAAILQVGQSPRRDEVDALSVVRHVTSIDHEGEGTPLVASAPSSPKSFPQGQLPDLYNTLIHGHWLQGSLRSWSYADDTRWIADEIGNRWPFMKSQWVSAPLA
jgi:FMN phosphatase YigB (HAD superfamily)